MPYLCFAINHVYKTFYRVNRTQPDPPQQDEDVDDDVDDEINFMVNDRVEVIVPNDQLDDTLLISSSTRQQDEYCAQQNEAVLQDQEQQIDEYNQYTEYYSFEMGDQYDYNLRDQTFHTTADKWYNDIQIDGFEHVEQLARQTQAQVEYDRVADPYSQVGEVDQASKFHYYDQQLQEGYIENGQYDDYCDTNEIIMRL